MGEMSPTRNEMKRCEMTRRQALLNFGVWLAASPLLEAADKPPKLIGEPPGRITPPDELVNVFEAEAMAKRALPEALFAKIAGTHREPFDRMTLQPRMFEPTRNMDLTVDLFGAKLFAPILAGPASRVERFHAEGESALVRGAASTKTLAVISGNSTQPLETLVREANSGAWYQIYPETDMAPVLSRVAQAARSRLQRRLRHCRNALPTGWLRRPAQPNASDRARKTRYELVRARPNAPGRQTAGRPERHHEPRRGRKQP